MLFIYGSLALGGIETFFVRMAKARAEIGMKTKILLLNNKERSNPELLDEMGNMLRFIIWRILFSCRSWFLHLFRTIIAFSSS